MSVLRPATRIIRRETPPPRVAPTDTTVWFVVGTTDRGDLKPQLVRSMSDFERIFGLRQSYSLLWDALDAFFREGGASAYVSRVVGPAAVIATKNLLDSGSGISLVVSARGPGAWANTYKVGVQAGTVSGYQIVVQDPNSVTLEVSPDLTTQNDAVAWSKLSQYITIALGATALVPVVTAPAVLAGGTDDRTNITDAQWLNALNLFTKDLGPGQVSAPGRTTDTGHTQLLAHAAANNRRALLDLPDSATAATLRTSVVNARVGNQRDGAAFAPWPVVPGVIPNTTRAVPPSALIAGLISRTEAQFGVNSPAAGDRGRAVYANDLSQPDWDDVTRDSLNSSGVNVIRRIASVVEVFGWRTLVDPVQDPYWINFANSRLYMAIAARADDIAMRYVLRQIDGRGIQIAAFNGDLKAMLADFYAQGALFGATPDDAFKVDTGSGVNTPTTLANNELRAVLSVRMSPFAELVTIEIVKIPPSEGVV